MTDQKAVPKHIVRGVQRWVDVQPRVYDAALAHYVDVCPLCGRFEWRQSAPATEEVPAGAHACFGVDPCNGCQEMRHLHPDVATWVDRVVAFHVACYHPEAP